MTTTDHTLPLRRHQEPKSDHHIKYGQEFSPRASVSSAISCCGGFKSDLKHKKRKPRINKEAKDPCYRPNVSAPSSAQNRLPRSLTRLKLVKQHHLLTQALAREFLKFATVRTRFGELLFRNWLPLVSPARHSITSSRFTSSPIFNGWSRNTRLLHAAVLPPSARRTPCVHKRA